MMSAGTSSRLSRARHLLETRDLQSAETLCREELHENPSNGDAWEMLAEIALGAGEPQAAMDFFNRALIIKPGDYGVMEKLAQTLLRAGNTKDALSMLKTLHAETARTDIALLLAQTYWKRGSYTLAEKLFSDIIKQEPGNAEFAVRAAQVAMSLGKFHDALELLQRFTEDPAHYPVAAGLHAIFSFDDQDLQSTITKLDHSISGRESLPDAILACAFANELANQPSRAAELFSMVPDTPRFAALQESFALKRNHWPSARIVGPPRQVLNNALEVMPAEGLIMEFGVFHGLSINLMAQQVRRVIHGFDSFQGLPEDWNPDEPAGSYSTHGVLPSVPAHVELHTGWFDKTLPKLLADSEESVAFIHMDCDLYSSTKTVLDLLADRIQPGSVIVFDDYCGFPGYREHEFKAFHEFAARENLEYDYLSFSLMGREAAVKIV